MRGVELYVPKDRLPPPEEDEFYYDDLIGLEVRDSQSKPLGTVTAVQNYGAGDILEIKGLDGAPLSVLFTKEAVPVVAIGEGFLTINENLLVTPDGEPEE